MRLRALWSYPCIGARSPALLTPEYYSHRRYVALKLFINSESMGEQLDDEINTYNASIGVPGNIPAAMLSGRCSTFLISVVLLEITDVLYISPCGKAC